MLMFFVFYVEVVHVITLCVGYCKTADDPAYDVINQHYVIGDVMNRKQGCLKRGCRVYRCQYLQIPFPIQYLKMNILYN